MTINKLDSESYFKELSSLILTFTTEYGDQVINKILDKDAYIKEPQRFFYTLIHKTSCSLEASNIFIRNFDSKRNYHPSLFIILRAILSDILVAEYITHCSESNAHSNELIDGIYFDHVDNIIRTCNTTFRHIYQWNENETELKKNELKANSKFYSSDGKAKCKKISTSLNSLIVKIWQSNKDKKHLIHHRRIFDLYGIFSKFEHLGELSFHLTHRGYDDTQKDTLYFDLYDSIVFIVEALVTYSKAWEGTLKFDLIKCNKLKQEIEKMHPKILK
ncbi:hypothetical protein [Lacinutrix sp. MEBiC02404]